MTPKSLSGCTALINLDQTICRKNRVFLQDKSWKLVNFNGQATCELWLPNNIRVNSDEIDPSGPVAFPMIPEGSLLGFIHILRAFTDYRGNLLRTGRYLMHFLLQPQIDAHHQTSPYRDFVVLIPLKEHDGNATPTPIDTLTAALKSALHPRILGLHPIENSEKVLPPLIQSNSGQLILHLTLMRKTNKGAKTSIHLALFPGLKAHIQSDQ